MTTSVTLPVTDPAAAGPYPIATLDLDLETTSWLGAPRPLHTVVWYPADAAGPFPVVVFSHGNGGRPDGSLYLTEHLASWGYIVAAPEHIGNTNAECPGGCTGPMLTESAANRPADAEFVADAVFKNETLGPIASKDDAAVIGFSLGGWTAINAAPSGRFDAMIALAPGPTVNLYEAAAGVHVPSLLMGGANDVVIEQGSVQRAFETLPEGSDRYLVWFPNAVHQSFRDLCRVDGCDLHDQINRYVVAFLQSYVLGDDRYKQYLADTPDATVEVKE